MKSENTSIRRCFSKLLAIVPLLVLSASWLPGQTNVLTWHNNNLRDGLNNTESTLTQATVTKGKFGKICSTAAGAIDGQIFGQPLVVTGSIPGYNHVVYLVTMNDSVYFIDGDSTDCAVIKHISLLRAGEEAVQCLDVGNGKCGTFNATIGILGTPVIDATTNTMYLVTWTESTTGTCAPAKGHGCFVHRLHALDITTGAEKFNGPVAMPAAVSGNAQFTSFNHIQRTGLLVLPNVEANGDSAVYVGFAGMDGAGVVGKSLPSGWMFSFDAKNLAANPVSWCATPTGEGGGLWLSGAGIAAGIDQSGGKTYLYVPTGDGTFDVETGGADYGDSLVKLTTELTVADYFTPYKQYCDKQNDVDLGAGGAMLIPNGVASSTIDFAVANGKDGNIYVMDRSNLGGYAGPSGDICPKPAGPNLNLQTIQGPNKYYTTPAFWNQTLYSVANDSPLQKYHIGGATCGSGPVCKTPSASTVVNLNYGPVPSISSNLNVTGTAIVWAVHGNGWPNGGSTVNPAQALVYAFDAEHVNTAGNIPVLWSSSQCPTRDGAGGAIKFVVPTVANGRVFVGTLDSTDATNSMGRLDVYGPTTNACN
jgi:hypothetical protein